MSDSFAQVGRRYFDDIIPEGLLILTTCLLVYTSAAPVVCKTRFNVNEVLLCSKNGSFIKWQCPSCPPGHGLSVECGRQYPLGTIIECVQCAKGRNFSDTNGISQCQQCTQCQENEVGSGSCEPDQDTTRCKCKPGYYRHHSASCKQCSWCCKDKTNEHEEECNVVQVPPEKQCSFTTEKSCAPSTTSVPASTPTIGPTSSNVTTNETVSPTTLDSPEVQTKSTDTNNLHGSVVLYVILGAVLVVLIAIIIAACILCNRQRSGNDSPREASSASSAMELNSSALLLSGNEDKAEQPTKEDNERILLHENGVFYHKGAKIEPKSCGQGKLNHPKKPSENAALEGTSMSRTTQVEHNSAEKDQKPEPKSDEERRPSIACPQSSSSLQNTMKEPEQEPDGASTSPIHPTDDSYERSDGGTIPGSNKSELLTVLLDDNHHSSRQDNEENISYPTQESLTDPDDCYDPLEEIQKNFKDGSNPFNDDLRQKKNVKKYTRFLLYVAKNATRKWEEIGGKLDIPPNELDTLKADHKSEGTAETAYQMLVRWRRRDHKPTLKKLLVALIATDLVEVAQKVPEMLRDSRSRVGEEVTNELFNEITNDVQDDWKFLGRYLGIDEDVILSIKADNSDNIREQTRQMLNKWKQGNGRQATTGYLINALHDVGRSDVVNVVREWIMKKT